METSFPNPALAAAAPAALEQSISIPATVPGSRKRIHEAINGVLFYGMLAFGMGFPIVATIYALVVY